MKQNFIPEIPDSDFLLVHITGVVQGVGFRPFVYRIAQKYYILGTVDNRTDGVYIVIKNNSNVLEFIKEIIETAPVASVIHNVKVIETSAEFDFNDFSIIKSSDNADAVTEISPDIAVCNDCLFDMKDQQHRIDYPFINCTNCGPRFSIIKALPYDRDKTTMDIFQMCNRCNQEYTEVTDRRFHAQPIACNNCGPVYTLYHQNDSTQDFEYILNFIAGLLESGKILAIKGIGGYFISCDATNPEAVGRLRAIKNRDRKPFAVMFRNTEAAEEFVHLNESEKELLMSWRKPIVLVKQKKIICEFINNGLDKLGIILPYMPLHYLLFEKIKLNALIMTSGNFAEEPIVIDDSRALESFFGFADAIITYNREIYNRVDDSVAFISNNTVQLIRRSRGFAPSQIQLDLPVEGILATGAELKNTFCIGRNNTAIVSQHIGDLKNDETYRFYKESIARFSDMFRFKPRVIASDLHPDYLSTKFAIQSGISMIQIQHHQAHIASCMAENKIKDNVIGVCLDGLGLGTDGLIWGGEFFSGYYDNFIRECHFDYIAMPGGDKASKEPWRMAVAYLYKAFGSEFLDINIPFVNNIDTEKTKLLVKSIDSGINAPLTSSCGRLFDAVSALTGICQNQQYEAEAAMQLEAVINISCKDKYPYYAGKVVDFTPLIKSLVTDIKNRVPLTIISTKFHNTLACAISSVVEEISSRTNIQKVVLSGGCFQNKYLLEQTSVELRDMEKEVFIHEKVPSNDGGIALGQLAMAAYKTKRD